MKIIKREMKLEIYWIPWETTSIYLASNVTSWGADPKWQYKGQREKYHLTASLEKGTHFKHFVLSEKDDKEKVRAALKEAGYKVTGKGNESPDEKGKWRTWFLLPDALGFKEEGPFPHNNNVW